MSFAEKLQYLAAGRVTVGRITIRQKTSDGGNVFHDRYMARIRGRFFVTGPCQHWHTEGRARRAGKKLLLHLKRRTKEIGVAA